MLTREHLRDLAGIRGEHLVSLFLPTHTASREIRQDPIRLKNLCGEAEKRLTARGLGVDEAAEILRPAQGLIEDRDFWRHQGKGLAIYLREGTAQIHRVSAALDEHVFIGDRFAVRPLVAAVEDPTSFFVLAIHQKAVRLLHCTRESAREVDLHDVPGSLADAVGYDWEEGSLQFHTGAPKVGSEGSGGAATDAGQRTGIDRAAVFHGHGAGGDDDTKRKEARRFLERVDAGITRLLNAHREPLVLAAAEPVGSMFRNLASSSNLIEDGIEGNTEHMSSERLHKLAVEVMAPRFEAPARAAMDRFVEVKASGLAAEGIHEVLSALKAGRAEALLVDPRRSVWGAPKDDPNSQDETRGDDLLDLAIHQALSTGARVFAFEGEAAPTDQPVAAILRY